MQKVKRDLELVVISDVHLGTYGSRAEELTNYLNSINPKILVLNGDFIDIWQFNKHYFPTSNMQVIKTITSMLSNGTTIYYITGNHDEMLRKFNGFSIGEFHIVNKLVLNLEAGKAWLFHGDVFDTAMKHSKWLAKLGGKGYDLLIILNNVVNWVSEKFGRGRVSLSKKVKDSVKGVLKYVNNFEETAAEIAIENGFDFVVCGHIHQPAIKDIHIKDKKVMYLNSGDWIENLTALEYTNKEWKLNRYNEKEYLMNQLDLRNHKENFKEALNYEALFKEVIQHATHVN
jgi:UDP-2,3-diacylglucosamine pyrophosphatase LpxH